MPGYSPKLPLELDNHDGFGLTQNHHEVAKQNLKMLILTNPGERIMEPTFGAGIRRLLFEPNTLVTSELIKQNIFAQVRKFLPYINIKGILITDRQGNEMFDVVGDDYGLNLRIVFNIKTLNIQEELDVIVTA
tara:strand:- start:168 stop:566 length:399 start_codon:yes stop_codon:yes gene_type:complete